MGRHLPRRFNRVKNMHPICYKHKRRDTERRSPFTPPTRAETVDAIFQRGVPVHEKARKRARELEVGAITQGKKRPRKPSSCVTQQDVELGKHALRTVIHPSASLTFCSFMYTLLSHDRRIQYYTKNTPVLARYDSGEFSCVCRCVFRSMQG